MLRRKVFERGIKNADDPTVGAISGSESTENAEERDEKGNAYPLGKGGEGPDQRDGCQSPGTRFRQLQEAEEETYLFSKLDHQDETSET